MWDTICDQLDAEDFYHWDHQLIYKAMQTLANNNNPIDVITLTEALAKGGQLDITDGIAYLFELANNTPSTARLSLAVGQQISW